MFDRKAEYKGLDFSVIYFTTESKERVSEILLACKKRNDMLKLKEIILHLIKNKRCTIFYFGGFSMFDDLCYEIVSEFKKTYSNITRIYCLSDPKHQNSWKRPNNINKENYERKKNNNYKNFIAYKYF